VTAACGAFFTSARSGSCFVSLIQVLVEGSGGAVHWLTTFLVEHVGVVSVMIRSFRQQFFCFCDCKHHFAVRAVTLWID
jgi:hypothetical protein